MKYVFVCRHGSFRSAVAARIVEDAARAKRIELVTDYFGVCDAMPNSEKRAILEDAERVYVMEENMRFDVERVLSYDGEIVCLGIPDKISAEGIMQKIREEPTLSLLW